MPKITKAEAAAILETSERTVERYANEKDKDKPRLSVTFEKGKTRHVPMYDEGEVRELARKLKEPTAARGIVMPNTDASDNADTSLSLLSPSRSMASPDFWAQIVARVEEMRPAQPAPVSSLSIADKLTLSLAEAARLSGLSRNHLRQAIEEKKLKARIIGRGWRVKRDDLDIYVRKL